ncbi:MAG: serine/threonine protein kinase [Clostridiales bacterium]|nr:serine/threonine protein kinase [Clostridiales bacterium]
MSKRCLGCMELFDEDFDVCPKCGFVVGQPAEEPIHMNPGTILHDRFTIGKVLGFGGFGATYLAWDEVLERKVAVKEYLPSEFSTRVVGKTEVTVFSGEKSEQFTSGMKKFIEEGQLVGGFQNEPGIIKIFDTFEENNTAYIVMEYLEGETLATRLKREKTIPEDEAVELLMPVMLSLQEIHKQGILHRDIAPENIFITETGEVKLIDFGASRFATTSYSRSLTVIIKQGYSPEEQYRSRGDQGTYTDVYALAATLYKMITGKTPPDAMERRAKYEKKSKDILVEPHKLTDDISRAHEIAILNALNVRIEDRTPDIATFIKN